MNYVIKMVERMNVTKNKLFSKIKGLLRLILHISFPMQSLRVDIVKSKVGRCIIRSTPNQRGIWHRIDIGIACVVASLNGKFDEMFFKVG